jgi:hypothetical protein
MKAHQWLRQAADACEYRGIEHVITVDNHRGTTCVHVHEADVLRLDPDAVPALIRPEGGTIVHRYRVVLDGVAFESWERHAIEEVK